MTNSQSSSGIFSNAQMSSFGDRLQIFGLGSQFDTQSLLNADLSLLQMQQTPYVNQKNGLTTDKTNWTSFQTSLTNFNNIVSGLKDLNSNSKDVTLSEDGYVSASATGSAMDATYNVSVQAIAAKQRVSSDQVADGALGINQTVQLNGTDLNITSDMDVKGIASAINAGSYGVGAVVLNNKLVLTSNQTGTSNKMTFSNSSAWDTLGITLNGSVKNELQAAQDSKFTINGIQMTSSSNTYTGIDGLTLNLSKVTSNDIDITVNRTADQISSKVKDLVDNYNKVITNINSLSAQGGPLSGQSIPRNLKRQMNDLLFSVTNNGTMMYQLGISMNGTAKDGTITFDDSKLRSMYNADPQKVQNMLTGANGFGGQLYNVVDRYAKSDGMIQGEINGLDSRIKRINDTLDRYQADFDRQKESLIRKYANFETMMSGMQQQNQYLTAQLSPNNSGN